MPELQMDVAVANRFISSLSKSLQALCHGCMDFDSGIEIVGYINVNIDSGSKVDYVLNEKVLKSTTNSMTFVSNSFLARKEQQKQTRDGACSPIPDMSQQSPSLSHFHNRVRGALHGSHTRGGSSFSFAHHSAQKRSWAAMERDWRMSPKKQRDERRSYPSHEPASTAPIVHPHPASSQNQVDANFKWPQTSSQSSDNNADGQPEINIKKEVFDSDNEKTMIQSEHDQSHTSDQETNDNSDEASKTANVSIKNDPDASTTTADDETHASDGAANDTDTDFKGTFLEPSTSEDNQDNTEHNKSQADTDDDNFDTSQLPGKSGHNLRPEHPDEPGTTAELSAENVTSGSELPVEFDEAGEEGAYPQSVYSDAGEGSSDAGQFEVIEIDDEDEDVQAMFGGSHVNGSRCKRKQSVAFRASQTTARQQGPSSYQTQKLPPGLFGNNAAESSAEVCSICCITLPYGVPYQQHFIEVHSKEHTERFITGGEPFLCEICHKGFITKERLRQHSSVHDSSYVSCYICDVKFKHKKNIKRHMESTHGLTKCVNCRALFKIGDEYNAHILYCDGSWTQATAGQQMI